MTTVVTHATGATAKPIGLLYVDPRREVLDSGSGTALADTGLGAAFLADLFSACVTHERCGVHLYRSVEARTAIEELREHYGHFGRETLEHVGLLEALISNGGGDPQYMSPSARATEKSGAALVESTYLLSGSVDLATGELVMLEAVMLAEAKDHDNWQTLATISTMMNEGAVRTELEAITTEVLAQEDEHYSWARDMRAHMIVALATGDADEARSEGSAGGTIDLRRATRDQLYAMAREQDISGRSTMTKDQLADALQSDTEASR